MKRQDTLYTVTACCRMFKHRFVLKHDGLKWSDSIPYEETMFRTREDAEAFAVQESSIFAVPHKMEITEHLMD